MITPSVVWPNVDSPSLSVWSQLISAILAHPDD
jgi:hypothetical protein